MEPHKKRGAHLEAPLKPHTEIFFPLSGLSIRRLGCVARTCA
jgi:hypothetical protein